MDLGEKKCRKGEEWVRPGQEEPARSACSVLLDQRKFLAKGNGVIGTGNRESWRQG
jgi:hypothetical protein